MNHIKETTKVPNLVNSRPVVTVKDIEHITPPQVFLSPIVKSKLLNINTIVFFIFIIFIVFFLYNCKYGIFKVEYSEPIPYDSYTSILRV
jgi:ABC-type uncharacterized transport system permease subunit